MKTLKCWGLWMGMALFLAANAFAAGKGSLKFSDPITVGGTQLKAGEYTAQWEGNGPEVELSIVKDKSVVAKTPARLVDVNPKPANNAIVTNKNPDGTTSLSRIQFGGKNVALEIGGESAQSETASSTK